MSKSKSDHETLGCFPQIYPNVVWCHELKEEYIFLYNSTLDGYVQVGVVISSLKCLGLD